MPKACLIVYFKELMFCFISDGTTAAEEAVVRVAGVGWETKHPWALTGPSHCQETSASNSMCFP